MQWHRTAGKLGQELAPEELGEARRLLVEGLVVYSHQHGVLVVVAFDAMGTGLSSEEDHAGVRGGCTGWGEGVATRPAGDAQSAGQYRLQSCPARRAGCWWW